MCPSMGEEDVETYTPKPKKPAENREQNPNKHFNQFLIKAILVAIFLVIVPLLPSQPPENPQHSRSWELLQLIFVGIAVSYGLFSKRNDDAANKEHHGSTTLDNAQSYVARLLQVSSVFDDDSENLTNSVVSEDTNKIQAWNSQYHREEPPVLQERSEKPLLLPVRSLKSRVSEPEMVEENTVKNPGPEKLVKRNSGKSRNADFPGLSSLEINKNLDQASVVLRSPIPWRSRSGRIVMREKDDQEDMISMEDSELRKLESSPRSVRSHSSKRLSPSQSFSSESSSSSRSSEEMVRKNFFIGKTSSPPPAPPPPPPPPAFFRKSRLERSNSGLIFPPPPEKDLKRSVRSVPSKLITDTDSGPESTKNRTRPQSVRTIRPAEIVPKFRKLQMETEKEKEDQYLEKVLVETDGDSSEPEPEPEEDDFFEESVGSNEVAVADEGPDVDKKADEFIAKFREQIRLQRIESIRRSTDQIAKRKAR